MNFEEVQAPEREKDGEVFEINGTTLKDMHNY